MPKINLKPMSVNEAWQGRRFKTAKYKNYERNLMFLLPRELKIKEIKKNDKLRLKIVAGLSSANADLDNVVKPFLDILQRKYGFNDKRIFELNLKKVKTEKKKEFIEFEIEKINSGKKGKC